MIFQSGGDDPREVYMVFSWVFVSMGALYLLQKWWTSYK